MDARGENYRMRCEGWICEQTENEKIWKEIKEKMEKANTKINKKIVPWKIGRRVWHSKEWKRKKRYLRKMLKRWKKKKISRKEFIRIKKDYRS